MADLAQEAARALAGLNAAGVTYALAGGLAVSLYAKPRATLDIDLLLSSGDLDLALQTLAKLGFASLPEPMRFAKVTIRRVTKTMEDDVLWIDLLLAEGSLAEILSRRQVLRWGEEKVPVVLPEDLITLKRLRGSKQDLADIEAIEEAMEENGPPSDT